MALCCHVQTAEDLEVHWAAEMGLRLLQERHACRNSSSKGSTIDRSESCSGGFWGAWVESLPRHAVTPVEFTAAEVQQLVMPSAVQVGCWQEACAAVKHVPCGRGLLPISCPCIIGNTAILCRAQQAADCAGFGFTVLRLQGVWCMPAARCGSVMLDYSSKSGRG